MKRNLLAIAIGLALRHMLYGEPVCPDDRRYIAQFQDPFGIFL